MKICPCGIAADDCTYHAPEPETDLLPLPGAIGRLICWGADGRWHYLDNDELADVSDLTAPKP